MFPAFTLDRFGSEHNGSNYGFVFFGYAIGAFVGPVVAAAFKDMGEAPYSIGLVVAAIVCFAGVILSLVLKKRMKSLT